MSKSKIEWTEKTWNPVIGCTKISEGCRNCYAERMAKRLRGRAGYPQDDPFRVVMHISRLFDPVAWRKPSMVFVGSMTDIFHQNISDAFLLQIFDMMINTPRHTYQILTKRPERMLNFLKKHFNYGITSNIWIGTSIENQQTANERIPYLLQLKCKIRFVSCEPLLGSIDLAEAGVSLINGGLNWVICGGESGPGARPMHPDWARSLRDQCQAAGVPFFFKQWGEWSPEFNRKDDEPTCIVCGCIESNPCEGGCEWITEGMFEICSNCGHVKVMMWEDRLLSYKRGKKAAGRLLDGVEWNQYPASFCHAERSEASKTTTND